jgi:hypothetical protein
VEQAGRGRDAEQRADKQRAIGADRVGVVPCEVVRVDAEAGGDARDGVAGRDGVVVEGAK